MNTKENKTEVIPIDDFVGQNDLNNFDPKKLMLFQNNPNPFNESTEVRFYSPENSKIEFRVLELSGKLVHYENLFYTKGWHTKIIESSILSSSGVYLYELSNKNQKISRKMVTNSF